MLKEPSAINPGGYALIDVLLGAALFIVLLGFVVPAYLYGEESMKLSGKRQRAAFYAEEGLEAVRNIRDNSFAALVDGVHGLATSTGGWALSGTNNTDGEFTRQIIIGPGSTADRKIATSTVIWSQNLQRDGNITSVTYLNNWAEPISVPIAIAGSASSPADGGTLAGPTATIVPPAGLESGDVIFIVAMYRGSATLSIANAGGQVWTALPQQNNGTTNSSRLFYTVYNGTWSSNPSVTNTSGTLALTGVMHAFRNVDPTVIDVAPVSGTFASPTGQRLVTIPGITTITPGAMVMAVWTTGDDNTWGIQTAGWANVGAAQYRNMSGNDSSISTAYLLMPTEGDSGDVVNRQLSVGGDAGVGFILALKPLP